MRVPRSESFPLNEEQIISENPRELYEYCKTLIGKLNSVYGDVAGAINQIGLQDRGDPSAYDWTLSSFTTSGNWYELNCSSIVPLGVRFIVFRVKILDDAVGSTFKMRKVGNTNEINIGWLATEIVDIARNGELFIPCNKERKVEYWASNVSWTSIDVVIMGWIF